MRGMMVAPWAGYGAVEKIVHRVKFLGYRRLLFVYNITAYAIRALDSCFVNAPVLEQPLSSTRLCPRFCTAHTGQCTWLIHGHVSRRCATAYAACLLCKSETLENCYVDMLTFCLHVS